MVTGSNPARAVPLQICKSLAQDLLLFSSPIGHYNWGWGPSPSSYVQVFCDLQCNLHVVRVRKMSHQHIRLAILLSGSGHDCVDLSPIENYNFGWGPNLTESHLFSFCCFTT